MPALFPTLFKMPVKFPAYPFETGIAIDVGMKPNVMYYRRRYFDINMRLLEVRSTLINQDNYGFFNRLALNENYLPCARYIEIAVVSDFAQMVGSCDPSYEPPPYVDGGDFDFMDFDPVDFFASPQNPEPEPEENVTFYTEKKLIFIDTTCYTNELYLRWLNPLGNWEGWCFVGEKDHGLEITESVSFLESTERNEYDIFRKGFDKTMVRSGGLSKDEAMALKSLYTSPAVLLVNREWGEEKVKINKESFDLYNESENSYIVEFELQLQFQNALVG